MRFIATLLLFFCFHLAYGQATGQTKWKTVSKDINIGYQVSFEYPAYWKFDWVENCLCLGKPSKDPKYVEFNNTMNWGIWMESVENFQDPPVAFYKKEFGGDLRLLIDTVEVAGYKATRHTFTQAKGTKFKQTIIIKVDNENVFEITNDKGNSADFKRFLKSIRIRPVNIK
jgi:hypothetical protein